MASPAPSATQNIQEIPLAMVGGNKFGRYNKISNEATWNFIVSDGWLVPYAGYQNQLTISPEVPGRGLYSSTVGDFMLAIIGSSVYKIIVNSFGRLGSTLVGSLFTDIGDVYLAENNNGEIIITDNAYIYIYNYLVAGGSFNSSNTAEGGTIDFKGFNNPGYVSFQNGRFIVALTTSTNWVLSGFNDGTSWSSAASSVGSLQTKPDQCQACVPMPGGGNNLLVFGRNCIEQWQDVGNALFPYQRASTFNIDFGCINPSTISHLKNYVVWLSINESSGPVLMVSYGGIPEAITTDGIDFKMGNITDPENCTGFLYQQDGHTIYQFTFVTDNLSYIYDFDSKLFFNVSDENLNFHIAREVVYFNLTYYFVSLRGGNVYAFDTRFTYAQYSDTDIRIIPRIRICAPMRFPDQRMFIAKSLGFTIENGQPNNITLVSIPGIQDGTTLATENGVLLATEDGVLIDTEMDASIPTVYPISDNQVGIAISRDGGETYGNFWYQDMNPTGIFKSRLIWQRLGQANDMTYQIRFNGTGLFACTDGILEVYK